MLTIKDLTASKELDSKAMAGVTGGNNLAVTSLVAKYLMQGQKSEQFDFTGIAASNQSDGPQLITVDNDKTSIQDMFGLVS